MNEDLHFTHSFHETLQQFPYPNIKLGNPLHHSLTNTKVQQEKSKMETDEIEKKEKI
jgi:hypothetical protein